MLKAIPQPGEFIRGHAERLSLLNGFQSAEELLAVLDSKARDGRKGWDPVPAYQLIAPLARLDPVAYLKSHSLLPFSRVGAYSDEDVLDYEAPARVKQRSAWTLLRDEAYLCSHCVAEDESRLGYSYWRAFHQIPGVDACEVHGEALFAVKGPRSFGRQPGAWRGNARPISNELVALSDTPAVARYRRIARAFLMSERRVSRFAASRCLGHRAQAMGFRVGARGSQHTLADCICNSFPAGWLAAHYPRLSVAPRGTNVQPVDGAARAQLSDGMVYAMALAATFASAEEAIHAFGTATSDPVRRLRITTGALSERRERLLPLYLAAEGRVLRVAEVLGVTESAAFRQLRAVGLPTIGKVTKSDRQRVISFVSKASREEVDRWVVAGSNISSL